MKQNNHTFEGKDCYTNDSFISITKEDNKIAIFSPEYAGDVFMIKEEAEKMANYILRLCNQ